MPTTYSIHPIGIVRKAKGAVWIELDPKFETGLRGITGFSHIDVYYWFDRNDTPQLRRILEVRPMKNPSNPLSGVFATHSPMRPNLIAHSTCKLIAVEGLRIRLEEIDAFDRSPVIDIKGHMPRPIRPDEIKLPHWTPKKSPPNG